MTINTPTPGVDFSGFNLSKTDTQQILRQAEIERARHMRVLLAPLGNRIGAAFRSAGDLFSLTQRMNQAARL